MKKDNYVKSFEDTHPTYFLRYTSFLFLMRLNIHRIMWYNALILGVQPDTFLYNYICVPTVQIKKNRIFLVLHKIPLCLFLVNMSSRVTTVLVSITSFTSFQTLYKWNHTECTLLFPALLLHIFVRFIYVALSSSNLLYFVACNNVIYPFF